MSLRMTHDAAAPTPVAPRRARGGAGGLLAVGAALLGLLAALAAGQAALTVQRQPDANAVVGEIVAGRRVGQTVIPRYSGLAGVDLRTATYGRPLTGTVRFTVRPSPHVTTTLASGEMPAATLPDNGWIHFAFPPLAVPAGTPLYFELTAPSGAPGNAPTLFWYTGPGDPYGEGRAVFDGLPGAGDLSFALHYAPPPAAPWLTTAQAILTRLPTRPALTLPLAGVLLVLLLLWGLGVGGWGLGVGDQGSGIRGPGSAATAENAPHASRITHYALRNPQSAILLAVLYAWLWVWIVPPWQGPDEPQHYAAAALWARQPLGTILAGPVPDPASAPDLEPAILAAMDRHGFTRTVPWYGARGGPAVDFIVRPAFGGSSLYAELRQPALYYRLAGLGLRLVGGDQPGRFDPDNGLYLLRLLGLAIQVGIVALGAGLAARLTLGQPGAGLRRALPLGLALWPMPVFVQTVANNDGLAALAVSACAVAALAWLSTLYPLSGRGGAWALLSLAAAGVAVLTKATAAPALVFIGGAALVVLVRLGRGWLAGRGPRARRAAWAAGLGVLVVGSLALLAGLDPRPTAWGWSYDIAVPADRRAVPDAHDGGWVLAPAPGRATFQRVDLPLGHPDLRLDAAGWLRAAAPGPAQLALDLDGRIVSSTTLTLPGGPTWTPITATVTAPAGSVYARVLLFSPGALEVDDLRLAATAQAPSAVLIPAGNLLGNPSAEGGAISPAPWLRSALAALPGANADELAVALLNPLPFDLGDALHEYADLQGRSFWGLFGWVAVPLPDGWYLLWWVLAALAVPGVLLAWPRLAGTAQAWLGLCVVALLTAEGLAVGKALAQRALFGLRDPPQGRYLFVLLIPILWLLLTGLAGWLPIAERGMRNAEWGTRVRAALPQLALVGWVLLLLYFAAWTLLAVIIPYYYGS